MLLLEVLPPRLQLVELSVELLLARVDLRRRLRTERLGVLVERVDLFLQLIFQRGDLLAADDGVARIDDAAAAHGADGAAAAERRAGDARTAGRRDGAGQRAEAIRPRMAATAKRDDAAQREWRRAVRP